MRLSPWRESPGDTVRRVFEAIGATRMRDLPILHPSLRVQAVGFERVPMLWLRPATAQAESTPSTTPTPQPTQHWRGVLITPWAMNLLVLPGADDWPPVATGLSVCWRFVHGDFDFVCAEHEQLGRYHSASLFSPMQAFANQDEAHATALAVLQQLALPRDAAQAGATTTASSPTTNPSQVSSRRQFLGLARRG